MEKPPPSARRTSAKSQGPSRNFTSWPVLVLIGLPSLPLLLMYMFLFIDTVTYTPPGALLPTRITLENWDFLFHTQSGMANIWQVAGNTVAFAAATTLLVLVIASLGGYALSRLNTPFQGFLLGGVMVLHAFPSVTLLVGIFLVLQMVGLYNTLIGVILVKATLELPLGMWIMKGFYDTVPWEIEMAGIQDGASRFTVWRRLVLPQVGPGLLALGLFSFLAGWSEYILPLVLAPAANVQVLSVFLSSLVQADDHFDINLFKAVGVFYMIPVLILFVFFQKNLMNIYGGGSKG